MKRHSRACSECGGCCSEHLLVCAGRSCKAALHSYCERPPHLRQSELWRCGGCLADNEAPAVAIRASGSQAKRTICNANRRRAKRAAVDADPPEGAGSGEPDDRACHSCGLTDFSKFFPMLLCDAPGCELGWHAQCLKPPLRKIPRGTWLCPVHVHDNAASHASAPTRQSAAAEATPAAGSALRPATYRQQIAAAVALSNRDTALAEEGAESSSSSQEEAEEEEEDAARPAGPVTQRCVLPCCAACPTLYASSRHVQVREIWYASESSAMQLHASCASAAPICCSFCRGDAPFDHFPTESTSFPQFVRICAEGVKRKAARAETESRPHLRRDCAC